jgi:hypothetical protein
MSRFILTTLLTGLCLAFGAVALHAAPAPVTKLSAPTLQSPDSGTTVTGSTIALSWQPSLAPAHDPLHYRLDIDTEADFKSTATRAYTIDGQGRQVMHAGLGILAVLIAGLGWRRFGRRGKTVMLLLGGAALVGVGLYSFLGGFGGNANERTAMSCMVDGLAAGKTYYWRVTAIDERTPVSAASNTWHFTVR